MERRKPSIALVSHHSRHNRSIVHKHKYPSLKKKRSNSIIHVTIGLRKKIQLNLKKSDYSMKESSLSKSSRVTPHGSTSLFSNVKLNNNDELDRTGIIQDYHQRSKRNKRKKYSRRYIITSVLITLLVILIIATVLPVLLIKSTTKTIISSNLDNTPVLRWNSNGITTAGISGSPGSANNQLNLPHDIVFDYANNLYIADRYNHRIQKYLFGSSIGQTVAGNVTSGFSLDKFSGPTRVLMDSNENLYIADTGNARIQFWRKGANSGTRIAGAGYAGNSSNELYWPHGIALHPTSNILYIVDTTNHRIMSYTLGNNSGTLVFGFNGAGNSNTQLSWPIGLHFDILTNSLVISNHGANKIVRHVLGSSFWTLIAGDTNGVFGTTPAKFNGPIEAAFDPMGNLYVADRNNHRTQFFYAGQLNATTIAGITGVNDTNATTLHAPWSLRLDSQLNLYVSDTSNHRIQKFLRY